MPRPCRHRAVAPPARTAAEPYRAYKPRPFTRAERDDVTMLFGGLHWRAERMLQASMENLGYKVRGAADRDARGPAHGTRGGGHRPMQPDQLHHRQPRQLPARRSRGDRRRGSRRRSTSTLTAGSCGACRFGQYHQSYELALRNVGLDVVPHVPARPGAACDQGPATGGGLELNLPFTLGMRVGDRADRRRAGPRVPDAAVRGEAGRDRRAWPRSASSILYEVVPQAAAARQDVGRAGLAPRHRLLRRRDARGAAPLRRDRGRSPARQAGGEDHRRVLPADGRGRSQLQHPPLARSRGRARSIRRRSRSGSTTCCGSPARTSRITSASIATRGSSSAAIRAGQGSAALDLRPHAPRAWATCRTSCRTSTSCAGWPRRTSTAV